MGGVPDGWHASVPHVECCQVRANGVRELELSFTHGRWSHDRWGSADSISPTFVKPSGVELWAWLGVNATWRNLTHALSGLFCASLNFLETSASSASPRTMFRPDLHESASSASTRSHVRYGALPREAVCTENLTPWLKLLPCRDKAGLATLLHRPSLYRSIYHSMHIHMAAADPAKSAPPCGDAVTSPNPVDGRVALAQQEPEQVGTQCSSSDSCRTHPPQGRNCDASPRPITLRQSLTLVLDPSLGTRNKKTPKRAEAQPPVSASGRAGGDSGSSSSDRLRPGNAGQWGRDTWQSDWSLSSLFGRGVAEKCLLADSSQVYVEVEQGLVHTLMHSSPGRTESSDSNSNSPHFCPPVDYINNTYYEVSSAVSPTVMQGGSRGLLPKQRATRTPPEGDDGRACWKETGTAYLQYGVANAGRGQPLDVSMRWKRPLSWKPLLPPFTAKRFITGHGNERGGIVLQLRNNDRVRAAAPARSAGLDAAPLLLRQPQGTAGAPKPHAESRLDSDLHPGVGGVVEGSTDLSGVQLQAGGAIDVDGGDRGGGTDNYVDVVPWFVRLYLHTMALMLDGRQVSLWDHAAAAHIQPAEDRKSPAVLELELCIPWSVDVAMLTVNFDKGYLYLNEYPADASRGLDLPAAVVMIPGVHTGLPLGNSSKTADGVNPLLQLIETGSPLRVYTEASVVLLPLPDFSMPYNVITLTCTVLAMLFGSLLNTLRRRLSDPKKQKE
eukprot:jgi/Mesen1/5239/ME000026S04533